MSERAFRPDGYAVQPSAWMGSLPSHWRRLPLKRLFRVCNGSTPRSSEESYWDGDIAWATPDDLGSLASSTITVTSRTLTEEGYESCGTTLVPIGSIVLSTRAPIGHVAIAGRPICRNQGCRSLVPCLLSSSQYFYYMLYAARPILQSLGQGSTFVELGKSELERFPVAVPPLAEQEQIADFLDRETAKIDALVAKKRRLVELLEEKRTALISHAVTKGLDRNVPMKDSRSRAWKEIPAHWEMKELRRLTPDDRQIMYGIVLPGPDVDDGVLIVKGHNCEPGHLRPEFMASTTHEIECRYVRSRLKKGDIVYAIRGSIGAAEIVPEELAGANMTQDAARIAPREGVNGRWLLFAVRSAPFFSKLEAGAIGAAVRGINIRDLKRGVLPVPPPQEQSQIATFLGRETERLADAVLRVRQAIDRLNEYRTALISAAVTGKIDVRGA